MSLQTRFTLVLIVLLIAGGLGFTFYLDRQQDVYQRQIMDRLALILQLNVQRIQERVNNALMLLWPGQGSASGSVRTPEDLQRAVDSLTVSPDVEGLQYRGALEFVHIVDSKGKILASTDPTVKGRMVNAGWFQNLRQLQKPKIIVDSQSHDPRILYYQPMFMFGYEDFIGGIIGGMSLQEFVEFRKSVRMTMVYGSTLLLIVLIVTQGITNHRFVFRPLRRVQHTIHGIMDAQDLSLRVPVSRKDEIGDLSQSFNVLLDFIQKTMKNLHGATNHLNGVSKELEDYAQQLLVGARQQLDGIATTREVLERVHNSAETIRENMKNLKDFTNETAAFLRQAETSTDQIVERTGDLSKSLERNARAVEGITRAIRDVSHTGEELSASVTEAVAAVTELNFSIREVENSAREAAQLAVQMVEDTELGRDSVQSTVQSMLQIQESFQRAFHSIGELIHHTEAINKISASIQNIASQTHLLSINASILAAEAGEHGRSFAVIVNQIQGMANQTSEYTREINQLIHQVRGSSQAVQGAMEESDEAVRDGVDRADRAQKSLDDILTTTHKVNEYVMKIAQATGEQARGSGQIQEAINRVNDIAGALNDVLQNLGQASKDIEKSSGELTAFAENLRLTMNTQAQSNRSMFKSVAQLPTMLDSIQKDLHEQRNGVQKLANAMEDIRMISEMNTQLVQQLQGIVTTSREESSHLVQQLSEFES